MKISTSRLNHTSETSGQFANPVRVPAGDRFVRDQIFTDAQGGGAGADGNRSRWSG